MNPNNELMVNAVEAFNVLSNMDVHAENTSQLIMLLKQQNQLHLYPIFHWSKRLKTV
jgi:hypothetical protein